MDTGFTPCLSVTFVNKSRSVGVNDSALEYYVALEYAAVPCVNNITTTICEVRVYEQVSFTPDAHKDAHLRHPRDSISLSPRLSGCLQGRCSD